MILRHNCLPLLLVLLHPGDEERDDLGADKLQEHLHTTLILLSGGYCDHFGKIHEARGEVGGPVAADEGAQHAELASGARQQLGLP